MVVDLDLRELLPACLDRFRKSKQQGKIDPNRPRNTFSLVQMQLEPGSDVCRDSALARPDEFGDFTCRRCAVLRFLEVALYYKRK